MHKSLACLAILAIAGCGSTAPAKSPPPTDLVPITTTSEEARSLFLAGRTKEERFHAEDARKDLEAAVALDPMFAMAWLQLSQSAPSREAREACLARAELAVGSVTEAEQQYVHAAMAFSVGRIDQARELLLAVTERYPGDPRAHFRLAMNYWASEDRSVITSLRRAVELDPGFDVGWNMLGYAEAHFGDIDAAVAAHRTYVELLPDEPNARDSYAETLLKAGRYEESIRQYERALALDPSFVWSRLGIGHNLVFLKRYGAARAAYEKAMAEAGSPSFIAAANDWLVVLAIYAGQPKEAIGAAERGVGLNGKIGDFEAAMAVRTLARVHLFAGDTERARELAGQALARLGEDAAPGARRELAHSVIRLLVEIDAKEGDFVAAGAKVGELQNLSETPWDIRLAAFTEGWLALESGDAMAALEAFGRAPLPSDPRFLFHMGEARLRAGQREGAGALFQRVVDYNAPSLGHAIVYSSARAHLAVLRHR